LIDESTLKSLLLAEWQSSQSFFNVNKLYVNSISNVFCFFKLPTFWSGLIGESGHFRFEEDMGKSGIYLLFSFLITDGTV